MVKWLFLILGITCLVLYTIYCFQHPDMTQTRAFINRWYYSVGAVFFIGIAGYLKEKEE